MVMADAMINCICENLQPIVKFAPGTDDVSLADSLSLLRAVQHRELINSMLQSALALLGKRSQMMPWVQAAVDLVTIQGHNSQVCDDEESSKVITLRDPRPYTLQQWHIPVSVRVSQHRRHAAYINRRVLNKPDGALL